MTRHWKTLVSKRTRIVAAVAAGLVLFGYLALRFGGELLEPWLAPPPSPADTNAIGAVILPSGAPQDSAGGRETTGMIMHHGPFVIDGMRYRIEVQRDTGPEKESNAARRVAVFDSTGARVYDENLFLRLDSTSAFSSIEFYPTVLEDESGIARALTFGYVWSPSAPASGYAFHVVAPRGRSLAVLTPGLVSYLGMVGDLPPGRTPGSRRLLAGNRMIVESLRWHFDAMIPLRFDLGCAPLSAECVTIDLRDSIGGLARFQVRPNAREKVDTAVVVELFAAPSAPSGEKVTIPAGTAAEILGGAGRVFFDKPNGLYVTGSDEWLEIRVNGRTGWITGAESFRALGLRDVG